MVYASSISFTINYPIDTNERIKHGIIRELLLFVSLTGKRVTAGCIYEKSVFSNISHAERSRLDPTAGVQFRGSIQRSIGKGRWNVSSSSIILDEF